MDEGENNELEFDEEAKEDAEHKRQQWHLWESRNIQTQLEANDPDPTDLWIGPTGHNYPSSDGYREGCRRLIGNNIHLKKLVICGAIADSKHTQYFCPEIQTMDQVNG